MVFLGGGLGSLSRYWMISLLAKNFRDAFPFGTLAVNVLGSFLIGLIIESASLKWNISVEMRMFLVTGFLGGFTTFSAFSLDFYKLTEADQALFAFTYVLASVFLSLAAVFSGVYMIRLAVSQ